MSKNAHNVVGKCDSMLDHCTDHQARYKLLSHLFIFWDMYSDGQGQLTLWGVTHDHYWGLL